MKKIFFVLAFAGLLYSCEEVGSECATCSSVKKNLETGSIESTVEAGTFCGSELDSVESILPETLDNYEYSMECK